MRRNGKRSVKGAGRALLVLSALGAAWWLALGSDAGGQDGAASSKATEAKAAAPAGEGPRAIEMFTPYCPSCRRMSEVVEEINARCAVHGVRIEGVDVSREENEPMAEAYDVHAVPTFLFLDESGRETLRLVGAQSPENIESALAAAGFTRCAGPTSSLPESKRDRRV